MAGFFATAMRRSLDERRDHVQAVIKAQCTAIHPVVEWRFRAAALRFLEADGEGQRQMEPIVFPDVIPLYGLSDIRRSSSHRSEAIAEDLIEQLSLAFAVIVEASAHRSLPGLDELGFRLERTLSEIEVGLSAEHEVGVLEFLRRDVESLFDHLVTYGPSVRERVEAYRLLREELEATVGRINGDFSELGHIAVHYLHQSFGREEIAADAVSGVDALVHLAGENVSGRWTSKKKDRILQSRTKGTRVLARAIVDAPRPPKAFISASAIGYYGDRGDELLDETSSAGNDFLAEVCKAWETQASAAASACRVVIPRLGIVLGPDGGALQQMVRPFRLGLGGMLGSGQQYMSWISRLDLVRLVAFALNSDTITGVVNAVSPSPVTNEAFTNAVSEHLHRPALMRVPAWAMKVGLGEFSGEVLSSKRVNARAASGAGFEWQHPTLELALQWALPEN